MHLCVCGWGVSVFVCCIFVCACVVCTRGRENGGNCLVCTFGDTHKHRRSFIHTHVHTIIVAATDEDWSSFDAHTSRMVKRLL